MAFRGHPPGPRTTVAQVGARGPIDVVLPVLDEADAIGWVLGSMPEGFRPIVVDNGSRDGSGDIARSMGARVIVEERRGFGSACWAGLNACVSDVVCFMDADGSIDPADLVSVAAEVESGRADLCLGRRILERGSMPAHSRLGNWVIARRVGSLTGLAVRDLGPLRAARRQLLLDLGLQDRRFGWPLEMVLKAARAHWSITEVDVAYHPRRGGRSKVTGTVSGTVRTVRDMSRMLA